MDADAAGRAARLRIILGVGAAALVVSLAIGVVGARRVNDDVARIRTTAAGAVVDQIDVVAWGFEGSGNTVADAFGAEPRELVQTSDLGWCAWIEISHLASSRSLYFDIGPSGRIVEAESC